MPKGSAPAMSLVIRLSARLKALATRRPAPPHRTPQRLFVQTLEDRAVPAGFQFTQATNTPGGFFGAPALSADGGQAAFRSNANLTGGNADGNVEVYLYNAAAGTVAQLTN